MTDAYPLKWPAGWPRAKEQRRADFGQKTISSSGYAYKTSTTFDKATRALYDELKLLKVTEVVLSSNLELRRDRQGVPYANQRISDTGVAVYFKRDGKEQCIPCDRWDRAEDNIKAVAKTIEALRGIERWGAKNMVDAAFRGFAALPAPPDYSFEKKTTDELRELMMENHPDTGTRPDTDKFQAVLAEIRRRRI